MAVVMSARATPLMLSEYCCRIVSSLLLGSEFFRGRAVLDLVRQKDQRLLVVEVKGRTARRHDRGGLDAFHSRKRRRVARAINCW